MLGRASFNVAEFGRGDWPLRIACAAAPRQRQRVRLDRRFRAQRTEGVAEFAALRDAKPKAIGHALKLALIALDAAQRLLKSSGQSAER
jgi:hypothetical protein